MPKLANRVKETTATTGTGTLTLAGAVSGFQAFNSALSNGDTTYYAITEASTGAWEVGLGTFTATSSLARTTIYASSNSGSAINLTAGDAEVFITLPASKTLLENQTITLSGDLSGSGTTSINAQIASNVVGANELNVSGNGTVGQALTSDGDGTFSWTTITPGISSVVEDTTPQLGGTLDGQLYSIENVEGVFGRSDINILTLAGATPLQEVFGYPGIVNIKGVNSGEVNIWGGTSYGSVVNLGIDGSKTQSVNIAAQSVNIQGLTYPSADGTNGQVLTTDGAGYLSFADASGGISLTDLSVTTSAASGGGSLSYNNTNGVFTFAPANYSAGSGLDLTGTTFSVEPDLRDGITHIGLDTTDYITFVNNSQIDFYINGSNEFRMEADGDFHADGDVIAYSTTIASDLRLKKDIVVVENALEKLHKLDGVEFKWKRDDVASAGVIAQQVQEVLPQAVREVTGLNGEDHLTVNYGALTAVLIEAIKELTAKVDSLEIALRDKEGR